MHVEKWRCTRNVFNQNDMSFEYVNEMHVAVDTIATKPTYFAGRANVLNV